MVHDVSRALMWLFTFSLNLAHKTFEIPTRYNATYSQREILRGLTFISLETAYAEGGLKRLTKRLRRANKPKNVSENMPKNAAKHQTATPYSYASNK